MFKKIFLILLLGFITSCTSYSSNLVAKDEDFTNRSLKKGETCSKNLFGGFKVPYLNNPVIKLSGSESIRAAIRNGFINKVLIVDKSDKHYLVYSTKCVIVYGY